MLKSAAQYVRRNAVAFLALFVALGSAGAYANDEWNGSNIQDETITGADILGKGPTAAAPPVNGSITTYDIAGQAANATHGTPGVDGTLTTYDIADGQVRGVDLRDGTVANIDLGADAVTGDKVDNSSLAGEDLMKGSITASQVEDGTLSGIDVADGTIERRDLATGVGALTDVRYANGEQDSGGPGERIESRAQCPDGWDVTGGGYDSAVPMGDDRDISVGVSRGFQRSDSHPAEWWVRGRNAGHILVGNAYLRAYVICVH